MKKLEMIVRDWEIERDISFHNAQCNCLNPFADNQYIYYRNKINEIELRWPKLKGKAKARRREPI